MKKILSIVGLCFLLTSANAQRYTLYTSDSLLGSVKSLLVSSSYSVTNYVVDCFNTASTNRPGTVYTNLVGGAFTNGLQLGTLVTNWGGGDGSTTVVNTPTNGIANITNDYTQLLVDALVWPVADGSLNTNLSISVGFQPNLVATGYACVALTPIIKGPLLGEGKPYGNSARTWISGTAGDVLSFYVALPSAGVTNPVAWVTNFVPKIGVKGYRLTSLTVTNGSIWVQDISINGNKAQ